MGNTPSTGPDTLSNRIMNEQKVILSQNSGELNAGKLEAAVTQRINTLYEVTQPASDYITAYQLADSLEKRNTDIDNTITEMSKLQDDINKSYTADAETMMRQNQNLIYENNAKLRTFSILNMWVLIMLVNLILAILQKNGIVSQYIFYPIMVLTVLYGVGTIVANVLFDSVRSSSNWWEFGFNPPDPQQPAVAAVATPGTTQSGFTDFGAMNTASPIFQFFGLILPRPSSTSYSNGSSATVLTRRLPPCGTLDIGGGIPSIPSGPSPNEGFTSCGTFKTPTTPTIYT